MTITEFAPAKINLTLHVTGRRADGYHLIDSLVVFCAVGDRVSLTAQDELALTVTGPFAAGLSQGEDNLVLRAAATMGTTGISFVLDKHLPPASGIGGGSADAAATLRAIARWTGRPLPDAGQVLGLGADVPVCLQARPARMRGVGEVLTELPAMPPAWLVLANPGVAVPTGEVFARLAGVDNPSMPDAPGHWPDAAALAGWLAGQRNDLQDAAVGLAPVIGRVLAGLAAQPDCLLARMSGSGATCFGLFAEGDSANQAANALRRDRPAWWIVAAPILS